MEQIEKKHGGYRLGAGRKSKYGVKTIVMRVPENRVQDVENLIAGGPVETVTESVESVTESKPLDNLKAVVERWEEQLKHHQDSGGQVKQPRWAKCAELWKEVSQVLKQSD
jgi:hypothetical protein